jgi:cobalt-zinc-cadmium efflux system membrane fusion protein
MTRKHKHPIRRRLVQAALLLIVAGAVGGFFSRNWWLPQLQQAIARAQDPHAGHDHAKGEHPKDEHPSDKPTGEEASHDENSVLKLSPQAQKNVGMRHMTIKRRDFDRTMTLPAMIIERPGRTRVKVSAPMTGIVTRIYPIEGEAVTPGQPLFDLRLTHEDLVSTQSDFLRTVEELDVIKREVTRLEKVTSSGAIAGKALLQRQYEQQKTEAMLHAQQQELILHGLSQQQVEDIAAKRKLLQQITVLTPTPPEPTGDKSAKDEPAEQLLQVAQLNVEQGQQVVSGELLCVLTDHASLYIQGKAFEEDAQTLHEAQAKGSPITALLASGGKRSQAIPYLKILRVDNKIELDSRALRFYVRLPNELIRNEKAADGSRFIAWRYKPGQRVELLLPVERWEDRIVLPVDAVVEDGADRFVFQKKGDHFHRLPVHAEYRDRHWVVLGDDNMLAPDDVVVTSGAEQMHREMKKKARSGGDGEEDKHVGCSH